MEDKPKIIDMRIETFNEDTPEESLSRKYSDTTVALYLNTYIKSPYKDIIAFS